MKALAPEHPEWKEKEPFASLLKGDVKGALAGGVNAIMAIVVATHSGMTSDEFEELVRDWIATAKHPVTGRLHTEMVYQPMLELVAYLRASGFKTFIVSGGGVDFMRHWTEKVYGIPPENIVGSSGKTTFEMREGKPVFLRPPEIAFIDEGPSKAIAIKDHIGRRPMRRSATRMATCKRSGTRWQEAAPVLRSSCIIPTPSANGPTTAIHPLADWIRRSTKPKRKAGPLSI